MTTGLGLSGSQRYAIAVRLVVMAAVAAVCSGSRAAPRAPSRRRTWPWQRCGCPPAPRTWPGTADRPRLEAGPAEPGPPVPGNPVAAVVCRYAGPDSTLTSSVPVKEPGQGRPVAAVHE